MRALLIWVLLGVWLAFQPTPAAAHPEVLRTDPPAGAILDNAPQTLTITFTEPVESRLLDVSVVTENGARVDLGDARRLDNARQVQVGLGSAGQGGYVARWRALGYDGHIVAGAFNFGVGRAPAGQAVTPARTPLSESLTRWVTLVALCLLVGGVLFRQLVLAPSARSDPAIAEAIPRIEERLLSLIWAGFSIFLGASVVLLATQTLAAGQEAGISRLGDVLLGSRFGQLWIARMAVLSAMGAALAHFETPGAADIASGPPRSGRRASRATDARVGARGMALAPGGARLPLISWLVADPARFPGDAGSPPGAGTAGAVVLGEAERSRERWWWIAAGLGMALLLLFSLGGHPAVTEVALLAVPIDWIHRAAAVIWIGGAFYLAVIWFSGYASRDAFLSILRRFSLIALVSFAVLVPTGLFGAWLYIPSPSEIVEAPYGVVLLAKLALVAGMGAIGLLHLRTALRPDHRLPRLGRTLGTESLLGAAVLVAAALLVNLPPPQGQSQARAVIGPVSDAGQPASSSALTMAANAGLDLVTLTLDPPRPGNVRLRFDLVDETGRPVDDATVTVRATEATGISSESALTAVKQMPGRYVADWPAGPGRWALQVAVARPGRDEAVAAFNVQLPFAGARDVMRRSDQAMNQLQSMREHQVLEGGPGGTLEIDYTYLAPDRMRAIESGGTELVAANGQRYERRDGEWSVAPWPDPRGFQWPAYAHAQLTTDMRLLGIEELNGRPQLVVSFVDGQSVRYTFWIDAVTYLITQQRMHAPGHYMAATFSDFNAPLFVEPPE